MKASTPFAAAVADALVNEALQRALADVPSGFVAGRQRAIDAFPGFEDLRTKGRDIRDHTLAHLDAYLEAFEQQARAAGSEVHWAATAEEARTAILGICREANARVVTKSKSMVSEEIALREHLQEAAIDVVETDLGEYLIQLRGEPPSHIIAPAIHLRAEDAAEVFRRKHSELHVDRDLSTPAAIVAEARGVLREKFLGAQVGITGANFLVAETGSAIVVTNEGNADLTMTLPDVHIVLATIDKVVPTLDDAFALLRLLARSATGQPFTAYTTLVTGAQRRGDADGPRHSHIVLLDAGRTELLNSDMRDVLRCIRCGACMNHCPVYCSIGGHAYASVYPGPIGAVLTPALAVAEPYGATHLAEASTFCGRCEEVCPVRIPLVSLLRQWREKAITAPRAWYSRALLRSWAQLASRPRAYRALASIVARALAHVGGRKRYLRYFPALSPWMKYRDLPAPSGRTFLQEFERRKQGWRR